MEAIQKLLQSTGLSPDELIKQLSEYKAISGSQQISTADGKDENKNDSLTKEKTNGASCHTSDTNVSDISDKIQNGIRTECVNVCSTNCFNIDTHSDIDKTGEPQMYLCNTSSNSAKSDKSSVTVSANSSEVVKNEIGQIFQSDEPQNTNTAKLLCSTEIEAVYNPLIKSTDDNHLAKDLQIDKGTEQFNHDDDLTISDVFKSDIEPSRGNQNCEFKSDHESSVSEAFISEQLDSSEELSFNEELQISEEELKCDEGFQRNRESAVKRLSTSKRLTSDRTLLISENLGSDRRLSTDKNILKSDGLVKDEKIKTDGGSVLIADTVLPAPEDIKFELQFPKIEEKIKTDVQLLETEEKVKTDVQLPEIEQKTDTENSKSCEEALTNREVKSNVEEFKCDERLISNKELKTDKVLPTSKELMVNKRKSNVLNSVSTTNEGLKTVSELPEDKKIKDYNKLSSSDKLSLVFGLPLGKELNNEELSLSDKLRSAWGLPPAKMFKTDKPIPKCNKLKFLSWGLTTKNEKKTDGMLLTSKNLKPTWGSPVREELKSNPGIDLKFTWGMLTKSIEHSPINDHLKSVSGKVLQNNEKVMEEKLPKINDKSFNLECKGNEELVSHKKLPINEKLTENIKLKASENSTHNDDKKLLSTEGLKCNEALTSKNMNEIIEIIENSKYNKEISKKNLSCDDKLPINNQQLPTKNFSEGPSLMKTEKCDGTDGILSDTQNEKRDKFLSKTQDKDERNTVTKTEERCDEIYDLTMDDEDDDECLEVTCSEDLDYIENDYGNQIKEEVMDDSDDTIVNSEDLMLYREKCKEINAETGIVISESKEQSKDESIETPDIKKTEEGDDHSSSRKRPIMGYIRKRSEKSKEMKTSKPPWMDNVPNQSDENLNMREQIFSQLQQLRKRKITEEPLVDIVHPIPQTYPKRLCKNLSVQEESGSNLGIKIIEVRGGITDQEEVSSLGIKLTKTQDITKIKGWRRKKLLVAKENVKEPSYTVTSKEPNLLINIPVTSKILGDNTDASCSYPIVDKPEKAGDKALEDLALNVFASNNLEGFLTQQKQLNISYNVPNLESSNHSIDYLDSTVLMAQPQEEKTCSDNKRRYSLAENENCNTLRQNSKSDANKPRTLAEKRKLLEKSEVLSKDDTENSMIYSNIYYKGRKFTIPTRYRKAIYIDFNHKSKKQYKYVEIDKSRGRKCKLSILNSKATVKPEISYKPGPLCRKQFLQKTGMGEWIGVLKKLPKLKVQVTPKIGKPLHPRVLPFVKFETFEISEDRADFALSALVGNSVDKSFTFDVSYERQQEDILMRKKIMKEEIKTEIKIEPVTKVYTEDVDGVVEHMVDDLITCIENSEMENDIIKDDPDFTPYVEDISVPLKYKENKSKTEIIKGSARRTNLELKRLNVKVIEVNIEDDQKPLDECTKPYCKLGCVCSSLNKTTLPSDHCGNYQCIFKCKCAKKNDTLKFSLPPGTDLLSERTVSRLQDAAKKDLAKVEKEFTQTVIHANNKTIVFSDTKDRKRRSLKFPKRYQDYVETNLLCDDIDNVPIRLVEPILVPEKKQMPQMSPCFVKLQKLNLEHVIPYCWAHNTYDCDCGCTTLLMKNKTEMFEVQVNNSDNAHENDKAEEFQEKLKSVKMAMNCARTKGIATLFYLQRNRLPAFKRKIAKKILTENSDNTRNYLLQKWYNMRPFDMDYTESNEWELPPEPISSGSVEVKASRRKQVLITRDELAQRAKESHSQVSSNQTPQQEDMVEIDSANSEDLDLFKNSTEVYKPSELVGEKFNQLLGMSNDKESDYRLLQWSTLLKRYESGVWEIWTTRTESKVRFVITNSIVKKVHDFINIRSFDSVADKESIKTDFIRWIMTRSFPGNKDPENTLLILKKTHPLWEVCGMCAKNTNKKNENSEEQKSLSSLKNSLFSQKIPYSSCEYWMKELAPSQTTSDENPLGIDMNLDESAKIKACVPNIAEGCKWRILKVNSTFNVLAFTRNQVRIKCSELLSLIKLSQRMSKSVIINKVSESYTHKLFGIYISYNHLDKIFIGPYFDNEAHDFETLRFLNNKLVSTEEFCKMTGQKIDAPTGTWFKQLPSQKPMVQPSNSVIDLTENEDNVQNNELVVTNVEKVDSVQDSNSTLAENYIVTKPNENSSVKYKGCVAKSPRSLLKRRNLPELNEVVINNEKKHTASIEKIFLLGLKSMIKHANYVLPSGTYPICFKVNFSNDIVLGFKYVAEEMVGVYWPTMEKPRLFQSHILATEWLRSQLSNIFVFMPRQFRISVSLVEYPDYLQAMIIHKKYMPLAAYLEEVHVVGSFGLLKMIDVVTLMSEYDFRPTKPKDLRNKLENNSIEYRRMVLKFLKKYDIFEMEFVRPLILQMVALLEKLQKIEKKQIFSKEKLQKLKTSLQDRYVALLGETQTFAADVICLDSDEEDSKSLKTSSTILENLNTTITLGPLEAPTSKEENVNISTPELTITPIECSDTNTGLVSSTDPEAGASNTTENLSVVEPVNTSVESANTSIIGEDSVRHFINIANLSEKPNGNGLHLNVNTFKRHCDVIPVIPRKNIVLTLLNPQVLTTPIDKTKVPKNLPMTKVLMLPKQALIKPSEPIERIDLSSFSTNSVSNMLGANLNGKKVMLTKAQLNSLKAISEQSKLKRLFLNKVDCDKDANMLDDPLPTT